jgi:hypothetical protein
MSLALSGLVSGTANYALQPLDLGDALFSVHASKV